MKLLKKLMTYLLCAALLCLPAARADPYRSHNSSQADTSVSGATAQQLTNISLAADAIDGYELAYGERFSFNDVVGERSAEAGYKIAPNGRGARVRGGGVSQVASTLLLALLDFEWAAVEDYTVYGDKFVGDYVDDGSDAIVTDYKAGYDLAFVSYYPGTLTVEVWMSEGMLHASLTGFPDSLQDGEAMGTAVTPMSDDALQVANVRLAASLIDGYEMTYGEKFSFNGVVGPRVESAGFVKAANGRGVRVCGGGVAQVASTIYLAAKQMDNVTIDPVRTYGDRYTGNYVDDPADAIVTDYNAGIDFAFTYYGANTLVISLDVQNDAMLYCGIYEVKNTSRYGE